MSVIEGMYKGQKALLTDGVLRMSGEDFGNWVRSHQKDLAGLAGAGILDLAGQRIFYEQLAGKKKLVICGAGHVGLAVARLGLLMQYQVIVIEDRMEFAEAAEDLLHVKKHEESRINPVKHGSTPRHAAEVPLPADENPARIVCGSFSEELEKISGDPDTSFIIVTRGHCNDLESLKVILRKERAYVGVMGSRTKTVMIRENLEKEGYSREAIDQIHMPIGLAIGARTPEEIAVSVIGEIIQVNDQGKKRFGFPRDILKVLSKAESLGDGPLILATVIRKEGSGPRDAGARMLLYPDGRRLGTVGGGVVEARTIERAEDMFAECMQVQHRTGLRDKTRYFPGQEQNGSGQGLADKEAKRRESVRSCRCQADAVRTLTVDINGNRLDEGKMVCGGRMEVLLELFREPSYQEI